MGIYRLEEPVCLDNQIVQFYFDLLRQVEIMTDKRATKKKIGT